jgi:hypothetical protein
MNRQLGPYFQPPSMVALEERIRFLEQTVAVLTDALRVLSRALEDGPLPEPGRSVDAAARQAHDLLVGLPRR